MEGSIDRNETTEPRESSPAPSGAQDPPKTSDAQKIPEDAEAVRRARLGRQFPLFLLFFLGLALFVVRPLLQGLTWGVLLAFFGTPLRKLVDRNAFFARSPNLSTAAVMLLLLFLVTIPLIFVLQAAGHELFGFYVAFSDMNVSGAGTALLTKTTALLPGWLRERLSPYLSEGFFSLLAPMARSAASLLQGLSRGVLQWTGAFLLQGTVAIMTMFFFIRDGGRVVRYVEEFIPLPEPERRVFCDDARAMLRSVIYGIMLTVAVQAALAALGWWVAGLPNVFLAAAAMFVAGMLPMGTSLIWAPGAIYLLATGSVKWGLAYLAWGALIVTPSDNILRPLFIGGGTTIPTLAVIVGVIGGLAVWGLLGVFLGPLALALFLSVLELYRRTIRGARDASG